MVESIEHRESQSQRSLIEKVFDRIDDPRFWIIYYRINDSCRVLKYAGRPKGLGRSSVCDKRSGEVIGDLFGVDILRGLVHIRTDAGRYREVLGRFV